MRGNNDPANPTSELAERLRIVRRLLQLAEQAHLLARQLHQEVVSIRAWEPGPPVTPVGYSLGISHGDAEIAANRLAGLRNELQRLVGLLEQETRKG